MSPLVALRSRRHIAPFVAERPDSVAAAQALRAGPGASAYMAGGMDLIDWLKLGHALDRVIRLDGVPGLAAIAAGADGLRIGACATHGAIVGSDAVRGSLPDLAALWGAVANPRVRFTGTIGGNVMAGRSDYDGLPALLALGAAAEVAGVGAVAPDRLAMLEAPLVTGFLIADPAGSRLFCDRSLRPAISVWLGLAVGEGAVTAVRLAVGMAYPAPVCVALPVALQLADLGREAAAVAADLVRLLPEPASDGRASGGYRRRMAGVLTRRILVRAGGAA